MTLKQLILFIGLCFLVADTMMFISLFYMAYHNNSKTVLVDIDSYDEADIEYSIVLLSIPFILYSAFVFLQDIRKYHYRNSPIKNKNNIST